MSGELGAVAVVVRRIGMPVLAAFLAVRGDELLDVSVDAIVRAGGTRAIARALADTGEHVELLGEAEAAEGVARLVAAEGLAERSEELADEGCRAELRGLRGDGRRRVGSPGGRRGRCRGFAEAGQGMEEIGSAGALADVADELRNN